jgi:apolipoprotein N-acyltransferase
MLLVATAGWVLVSEWARAQTSFGFTWAFFGNAVADTVFLRQMAAVGGVWLLSALVVMANVALAFGLNGRGRQGWWLMPATVAGVFIAASAGGALYVRSGAGQEHPIRAAALQIPRAPYTSDEFRRLGVRRIYGPHVEHALANQVELLVLPESNVKVLLSLDGSRVKPASRPQSFLPEWEEPVRKILGDHDTILVIGLNTAEEGSEYNTLVYWSAQGILGWYHKRLLMPFAEYQPRAWGWWGLRGSSEFTPGRGTQLIGTHGLVLGSFICSEVLYPWVTRTSVRDGATVLVTGGNDGVFAERAVARVHADAVQLRAVETGRYIVRAMKTGISTIVDPHGKELVRSRSWQRALLLGDISARDTVTPYVRFGDWVVWLSAFLLGAVVVVVQRDVAGIINRGLRKSSEATAAARYGLR